MAFPDLPPRRESSRKRRRWLRFELLDERRVLASITGQVFLDADQSLRKDDGEVGLESRVVFIDLDGDNQVELGEPIALTDSSGRFEFADLPFGDYTVRLFNGTPTQTQLTPYRAELAGGLIGVSDPFSNDDNVWLGLEDQAGLEALMVSGDVLSSVDLDANASAADRVRGIQLPAAATDFQSLGGGSVLVTLGAGGVDPQGDPLRIVSVNTVSGQVEPVQLGDDTTSHFAALALGSDQAGLLVPAGAPGGSVPLHTIRYNAEQAAWVAVPLELQVASDAQLFGSPSSPVMLVSQPAGQSLQLALWSSATDSLLVDSVGVVPNLDAILAFDPINLLAVARNQDGGVSILDAANDYAPLHVLGHWDGPVALDSHRELLFGVISNTTLGLFDLRELKSLFTVGLPTGLGPIAGLALADGGNRVVVRSREGVSQVRIDRPDGHRVSLRADAASRDVLFGLMVDGANDEPVFGAVPQLSMLEDGTLNLVKPGLAAHVDEPDEDEFVVIKMTEPLHGIATVAPDGALIYRPLANFYGVDSFKVLANDGRESSELQTIVINVLPVNDRASGIEVVIPPLGESVRGPMNIGSIRVIDPDDDEFIIWISDPRFGSDGTNIYVTNDAIFDYETEPTISLTIIATNAEDETDTVATATLLTLIDEDDPPTDILPRSSQVEENDPGAVVAELSVVDQDASEGYVFEVVDSRFVIEGNTLRLAEGVSLDFESTPSISLPVSVLNAQGTHLLTKSIAIQVGNQNDAITDILLSGTSLPELASAYPVGSVSVVDGDVDATHELSVDDARFEIVNRILKLRNGVFVRRADQAEIEIRITATDSAGGSFSKSFVLNVLSNEQPWHNDNNPTDVDGNGSTTPIDALIIINNLNQEGPRVLGEIVPFEDGKPRLIDVNGDGKVSPIDALIIINILNRGSNGSAEPEGGTPAPQRPRGEGEAPATSGNPVVAPAAQRLPRSMQVKHPWELEDDRF